MLGAMDAAIDGVAVLHAVADDAYAAMRADRRERGDGAFERVEGERASAHGDLEALVIVVAALRAFAHGVFLRNLSPCPTRSAFLRHDTFAKTSRERAHRRPRRAAWRHDLLLPALRQASPREGPRRPGLK